MSEALWRVRIAPVLLLGACSSEGAKLELPPEAAGFGVTVRVDTIGTDTFGFVDATDSPSLLDPPIEGSEVAFLFYDTNLEALGLTPSRVYPNDGRFKTPDAGRLLEGAGTDGAAWRNLPPRSLPAWIEPFRLPGVCRPYRVKPINLPPREGMMPRPHDVVGLAAIDEDHVLISTAEGRFFRASWVQSGNPIVAELGVTGERAAVTGGYRSASRLWFGGERGLLASTEIEAAREASELHFEVRAQLPSSEPAIERLIVDIDGDPERDDDIFSLTFDGTVLHYDGARMASSGQIVGTSTTRASFLDTREVRWTGPRTAVAVSWVRGGQDAIYTFEAGGTPRPLVLPSEPGRSPSAVVYGDNGLFVATARWNSDRTWSSQVWLLPPRATDWILYTESTLAVFGMVMERYDGLVVGVGPPFTGMLASQPEGSGPECEPMLASAPLRDVVRTGPYAAVTVGVSFSDDANQLLWVR